MDTLRKGYNMKHQTTFVTNRQQERRWGARPYSPGWRVIAALAAGLFLVVALSWARALPHPVVCANPNVAQAAICRLVAA